MYVAVATNRDLKQLDKALPLTPQRRAARR